MSTTLCTTVSPNTDVLGKGIRINFYSTMLLLAVIPVTPYTEELLGALYANIGISGLGLLLTAIIQTAQNQLSLFHALFILHMLFFLGVGASPAGKYNWSMSRIVMAIVVQYASLAAFMGWSLYVWIHVDEYGSQPECNNHIKYVIMFVNVRATVPWLRGLTIAGIVGGAVALVVVFGVHSVVLFAIRRAKREGAERAEEMDSVTMLEQPEGFTISFPLLFSAIYSTVMLELTVHRNAAHLQPNGTNTGPGVVQVDDSWAFGQILSVVMIIANMNEVVHFILGFIDRRSRRRRLARERQAHWQELEENAAHEVEERSATVEYQPIEPSGHSPSICDGSPDPTSSNYELQNLESRNTPVSEAIGGLHNTQPHDQPASITTV